MSVEHQFTDDEINKYLQANYPVRPEAVDEAIKIAKSHETESFSAQAYLMAEAQMVAETHGIEGLPAMLAAVWKLEKDLPDDEKRLDAKRYLGLLMVGESTSARDEGDHTKYLTDSMDHARRSVELHDFWIEL